MHRSRCVLVSPCCPVEPCIPMVWPRGDAVAGSRAASSQGGEAPALEIVTGAVTTGSQTWKVNGL